MKLKTPTIEELFKVTDEGIKTKELSTYIYENFIPKSVVKEAIKKMNQEGCSKYLKRAYNPTDHEIVDNDIGFKTALFELLQKLGLSDEVKK